MHKSLCVRYLLCVHYLLCVRYLLCVLRFHRASTFCLPIHALQCQHNKWTRVTSLCWFICDNHTTAVYSMHYIRDTDCTILKQHTILGAHYTVLDGHGFQSSSRTCQYTVYTTHKDWYANIIDGLVLTILSLTASTDCITVDSLKNRCSNFVNK